MTVKENAQIEAVLGVALAPVPEDADFVVDGRHQLWLPAPELAELAGEIIAAHSDVLQGARSSQIQYLWRRKGPYSNHRPVFGRCVKASGLLRYFGRSDFVIWLAADHIRNYGLTGRQLEALLFHELMHVGLVSDQQGNVRPALRPHQWEGWAEEIRRYGLWWEPLERIGEAVRQMPLWEGE